MNDLDLHPIRYRFGPLDGTRGHTVGYPPAELNGYRMAHCKVGTYVYVWPPADMRRRKQVAE
ncbi:hypothetical protein OG689_10640 [Kitasatospora sp. NBC_00240]|uniref:hypothetical protein n=1 Tax=Kitasatospora sp. NBC_00240 TaxID=2903567 RepID=UPI0022567D6B|nr:hypothetical protein [Kitasatospora sp. NBC_00240]MCX5209740.1 hypothetical protein [Kitasatospora sp. NBC_00240]